MIDFRTNKNFFKLLINKLDFRFLKYHQGLTRQNIERIFFIFVWAVFMFCFIFMLEKLALVMGGSQNIEQGPPNVVINYVAPHQISSYITFFGNGLNMKGFINKVPHYISIAIIITTIIASVVLFWPFFHYEAGHKKEYYLIGIIGFYLAAIIVALVLAILFTSDSKSISLLQTLTWCIWATEMVSLFIVVNNYLTVKQMNKIAKKNASTIAPTKNTGRENYIDQLFYNVDVSKKQSKMNVSEDNFFDYKGCNNLQTNIRRQYIRSKKRELIFFNYKPYLTMLIIIGPTIIQQFIYASYGMVDKIFVVQFAPHAYGNLYTTSLTIDYLNLATRYGSVMQIIIFALTSLITVPGVIMFSYGYARHNQAEVDRVIGNSLTLTLVLSIILIPVMYFFIPIFINFQIGLNGAGTKIAANMATEFSRIIFYGFPAQVIGILFTGWLVAEGRSFTSLLILFFSALANCLLNWIILSYTNLGYSGSAMANVFIFIVTSILGFLAVVTDRYSWIRTKWSDLKPDKNLILNFFSMGTTGVLQALAAGLMIALTVHLTQTLPFNKADIGGSAKNPTNGLIQSFAASSPWFSLARSFTLGVVFGGRNILAYCYSAQQYQRFRKLVLWCFWSQAIWVLFYYILILIFAKNMIGIFINDPNLSTAQFGNYLRILATGIFAFPIQNMLILVYQSTGQNHKALFMSSLNAWVIAAPLVFITWNGVWSSFGQVNTTLMFFILINLRWVTVTPIMIIYGWLAGGHVRHILNLPNRESKIKTEINIFDKVFKRYNYNVNVMARHYQIPTEASEV